MYLNDCLFSMFCFSPPSPTLDTYFIRLCPLWSFHPSHYYSVSLTQWSLAWDSSAPWVHLAKSRDILGCYSQWGSSTDILRVEVKDTDKNHTMHGTASLTTKDYLAPNFNSAMVEKFCSNLILASQLQLLSLHVFLSNIFIFSLIISLKFEFLISYYWRRIFLAAPIRF